MLQLARCEIASLFWLHAGSRPLVVRNRLDAFGNFITQLDAGVRASLIKRELAAAESGFQSLGPREGQELLPAVRTENRVAHLFM